jgi:DNA replication protein DnaC
MRGEEKLRDKLVMYLRELRLPAFAERFAELAERAEKEGWSFEQYLADLVEAELSERRQRRIERYSKQSDLPREKTLATLDLSKLPASVKRQLPSLCDGDFIKRAENILAFGLPGRGKTHVLCAISHELIGRGFRVFFTPAYQLVQRLLAAKRDLGLEQYLRKLDSFDAVLIDDIGYIQQDRDEMEVLFTFLAERYERRSVMITSNLVFSEWNRIFKDPMTTAAAIDRLVHHSVILEMTGPTFRGEEAKRRVEEANTGSNSIPPSGQDRSSSVGKTRTTNTTETRTRGPARKAKPAKAAHRRTEARA